jgi:endonuclease/exonuclease/phosphatase family metal-dependent hydrolase
LPARRNVVRGGRSFSLRDAFDDRPEHWGLAGDPLLWEQMSRMPLLPSGAGVGEVYAFLCGLFTGLTNSSVHSDMPIAFKGDARVDAPAAMIQPSFWRERAIPHLLARACPGTPLRVVCWNVNNRVGHVKFRPEAAQAAMSTGADVLLFNEFFPGSQLERFIGDLKEGGWAHVQLSYEAKVKANRVLAASRIPFTVEALPPSPVDEHLQSNALLLRLNVGLDIFCLRVPTYDGAERVAAWDWVLDAASLIARSGPALLIGDLNTSLTSAARVKQFHRLLQTWRRLQPTGDGSFFGKGGQTSEIDHAMVSGHADAAAWYLSRVGEYVLAGPPTALSDHAALCVQLALPDRSTRGMERTTRNRTSVLNGQPRQQLDGPTSN